MDVALFDDLFDPTKGGHALMSPRDLAWTAALLEGGLPPSETPLPGGEPTSPDDDDYTTPETSPPPPIPEHVRRRGPKADPDNLLFNVVTRADLVRYRKEWSTLDRTSKEVGISCTSLKKLCNFHGVTWAGDRRVEKRRMEERRVANAPAPRRCGASSSKPWRKYVGQKCSAVRADALKWLRRTVPPGHADEHQVVLKACKHCDLLVELKAGRPVCRRCRHCLECGSQGCSMRHRLCGVCGNGCFDFRDGRDRCRRCAGDRFRLGP